MVVSVSIVYVPDRPAQQHEKASCCISLAQGEDQNAKCEVWFLWSVYQ